MTNQAYSLGLANVGEDVVVWPMARIVAPEVISIGDSVIIDDFVFLMGGTRTTLGSFNHIASFASILGGGVFAMADFAGVSSGARVYTGNDDYLGGCMTGPTVPPPYRVPIRSFVRLEKHVIVGANTVILPGVTVGEGAAVGANSLVTEDCEPWTVYAGSPARPLRARPRDRIIQLEKELRSELYSEDGQYIPKNAR